MLPIGVYSLQSTPRVPQLGKSGYTGKLLVGGCEFSHQELSCRPATKLASFDFGACFELASYQLGPGHFADDAVDRWGSVALHRSHGSISAGAEVTIDPTGTFDLLPCRTTMGDT